MHFHVSAICMHCTAQHYWSTPIPNILIGAEMCQGCGYNDLVGRDGTSICISCRQMWADDIEREEHWGRYSRA